MKIEMIEKNKSEICENILRSLPKWFGIESAIVDYVNDVQAMPMLAAKVKNETVGFLALNLHNKFTAEIHVMGILQRYHGKGIGKSLVKAAEDFLTRKGYRYLSVKTLSESRPNEEYDLTRKFYYSTGFVPVEEFKTLWGEDNPCLLMIKAVNGGEGEFPFGHH